jgi:hypothetical protein
VIGPCPQFVNSPYFVDEPDNWHLKDGAPEEVKKEFEEFMRDMKNEDGPRDQNDPQ